MSKDKDPESNDGLSTNNVATASPNGKLGFEMKIYPKPSAKDVAAARPCRVFIVFTFILFLVGFLIASIALLAITEKCNKRGKNDAALPSNLQYQINVRSFVDSDDDAVGDINGVASKLSYVKSLGADSILLTDVIGTGDFGLSPDIGTENDLKSLVSKAQGSGLKVFLQMNVFSVSASGRWFAKCRQNIADCQIFVVRSQEDENSWKNVVGNSAWYRFDTVTVMGGEEKEYSYYSYYNSELPKLNLRNDNVLVILIDKIRWWLSFGVGGFVVTDASRLTVEPNVNVTKQLDQDHPHNFYVLNQLYNFIHSQGAELWVSPSTPSLTATPYYMGTPTHPQAHVLITDALARQQNIDVDALNTTISTLIGSPLVDSGRMGWLVGAPEFSRVASRVRDEGQAKLLSLLVVVLPGHVLPYFGEEWLMKDGADRTTWKKVFRTDNGGKGNDSISSPNDMAHGFRSLAKLRTTKGVLSGKPSIVHSALGVLVLWYDDSVKESSSLVFVNFNSYESSVQQVRGCGRYAKVVFTVSPVDLMVDCSEVRLPAYGMFVAKLVY